ncbi:MAG: methylated-DNA--[protein]-cysteine S-methyltransferase [Acidimicrobiaceae bacterium]|nr:methylated-DNA--[protein]-cysteine S-methyltransferase [Acidimicrobiaceae bacterium]
MNNLDESRWRAVQSRDDSAAGVFVYGVSSTRIYCRPGCKSRQPLRQNVEYFATTSEADAAGYRSCRRCRPTEQVFHDAALRSVVALCRSLEINQASVDIGEFAAACGYSERHLRRRFSEVVGVPVATYVRFLRAERVRTALQSKVPVTEAIIEAGYGSSRAFYEHGAPQLAMTPGTYRAGGRGERITFTSLVTPIGTVIAAATERGVCAVRIGHDESTLEEELKVEFPNSSLQRDDEGLVDVAQVLARAVRGEGDATLLPIDLAGTAFQMRVWDTLRRIPPGKTLTYSQVAVEIGSPRAVRAVGSACAANPVALVVPCHRVIRQDGSLGGYRWGLEAKEALLKFEGTR